MICTGKQRHRVAEGPTLMAELRQSWNVPSLKINVAALAKNGLERMYDSENEAVSYTVKYQSSSARTLHGACVGSDTQAVASGDGDARGVVAMMCSKFNTVTVDSVWGISDVSTSSVVYVSGEQTALMMWIFGCIGLYETKRELQFLCASVNLAAIRKKEAEVLAMLGYSYRGRIRELERTFCGASTERYKGRSSRGNFNKAKLSLCR
ncbi:hypothetical protein C8J57DRAFT_1461727 [Mycena rebaudengoi]|nr:hypothetical protein C8J57DRAFT_1487566 [Mycena rebaudengoi]KAJ7284444.1 hypothetical protein C8J57DRAFT_1461727 [Mycena rebaudengoi]